MTTRDDVSVEYSTSPRIAEVAAPSVEMVMQDLVDTLRIAEESFEGLSFDKLLNASGKEDLGGGVSVGITVALQNVLLAFEARTTPAQIGAVTGNPASPVAGRQIIQDSAATFIANGIARGSLLINFTDMSIADVVSVDSETQLTTVTLKNGTSNTYSINDDYQVFNIIQVGALGGNLTAVDENGQNISPILPTAFTQVILTSSSSATTANQTQLEHSTFNGEVTVYPGGPNSISGTDYPAGTLSSPSDNMDDALIIAVENGLDRFRFKSNITITQDLSDGYNLVGSSPFFIVTADPSADMTMAQISNLTIQDTLDGLNSISECSMLICDSVSGLITNSALKGSLSLSGDLLIADCFSNVPGSGSSDVIVNSGNCLEVRDFHGSIRVLNVVDGNDHIVSVSSGGSVTIDTSCTGGTIRVRGEPFQIFDNSGVDCTVIYQTEGLKVGEIHKIHGLELGDPMTVTPSDRNAGDISQTITGDGESSTTVSRDLVITEFVVDESGNFLVDELGNNIIG